MNTLTMLQASVAIRAEAGDFLVVQEGKIIGVLNPSDSNRLLEHATNGHATPAPQRGQKRSPAERQAFQERVMTALKGRNATVHEICGVMGVRNHVESNYVSQGLTSLEKTGKVVATVIGKGQTRRTRRYRIA